ncbi:MAG: GAF domain-containing protein [Candidatus Dadabacteria bacterium]|nr:MAG: GAF domain-containing protein [Candidatus Dadabacteria bacterium]
MNSEEQTRAPGTSDADPQPLDEGAAEDFLRMFNRGADFLREVIQENQRLRYRLASVESQLESGAGAPADDRVAFLEKELSSWKEKYNSLLSRIEEVEEENRDFLQRYMEVEEENNNLANLYIASYQLHSTLNFDEVLQIILEIVINLIGAELFAVYLYESKSDSLQAVASEGLDTDKFPKVKLGEGDIGQAVAGAEMALFEDRLALPEADLEQPLAVIPLQIKDDTIGAIVIFRLLQQKPRFLDVDRELFHLLAGHAATAVFASRLYTESERKLSTMQGFIDLLTKS